jgi:hypothetical protein
MNSVPDAPCTARNLPSSWLMLSRDWGCLRIKVIGIWEIFLEAILDIELSLIQSVL